MTALIRTVNSAVFPADPDRIFELAADIERWPEILPHYRYVRVLDESPLGREIAMGASRSGIPVRWTAIQDVRPETREIAYRHTGGVTRGMEVVWRIDPVERGTAVSIVHSLVPTRWWLRPALSRYVVGRLFVSHIAERTMREIGERAARERLLV